MSRAPRDGDRARGRVMSRARGRGMSRARGRALVTGASRGIGASLAAALVSAGFEVTGTCRRPDALPAGQRIDGVSYRALDLTDPASVEALAADLRDVEVLVNNAGTGQIGPAEEIRPEAARRLFELSFFGPLRLVQATLPGMRARGRGLIVNVGSIRGELPMPFSSVYAAAKAALRSFSECLRLEVEGTGVRVTVLAPIAVRTEIPQERQYEKDSPYGEALRRAGRMRDLEIASAPDPGIAAHWLRSVLENPRPRGLYVIGRGAAWKHFLIRHLPPALLEANVRRMHRRG